MKKAFSLEYWEDDGWYVGRLREVPGVFSQGETLEELKENIKDAVAMMLEDSGDVEHPESKVLEVLVEVA